jgi:hypothetical protein
VRRFTRFACVDWSGARGPRQKGIAVACCSEGDTAPLLLGQPGHWSREAVLDWLLEETARGSDLLVGIDFSTSLPFDAQQGFFPGWNAAPRTARELWAFIESICADEPHLEAGAFVDHVEASTFFRRPGGRTGARFGTGIGRLRAVERRTVPSPASCFNLVGAKQVGKSSLTGMRLLHRLAGRTPIWPFDEAPPSGPVIVEIYTGLAAVGGRPAARATAPRCWSPTRSMRRSSRSAAVPIAAPASMTTIALTRSSRPPGSAAPHTDRDCGGRRASTPFVTPRAGHSASPDRRIRAGRAPPPCRMGRPSPA